MTDIELGEKVFKKLYDWSKRLYPTTFNYTYDQFKALYGNKTNIYFDGIGMGVREAGMSDSRIDTAMRSLASSSQGRAIKNPLDIFKYLQNEAVKINWIDAAAFVAVESAKDVVNAAADVGESLITAGKILNFLLPALVVIVVLWFVNDKTNGSIVRTAGAFKKGLK